MVAIVAALITVTSLIPIQLIAVTFDAMKQEIRTKQPETRVLGYGLGIACTKAIFFLPCGNLGF